MKFSCHVCVRLSLINEKTFSSCRIESFIDIAFTVCINREILYINAELQVQYVCTNDPDGGALVELVEPEVDARAQSVPAAVFAYDLLRAILSRAVHDLPFRTVDQKHRLGHHVERSTRPYR